MLTAAAASAATALWNELFRPLIVLALVVAVISVVTWHVSRPKAGRTRCPWCESGVHHTHADHGPKEER